MSGLYTALNGSVKALTAQSRGIEIAGKNLANVNNTTYARQRVLFGDRGTVQTPEGAQSLGIEALGIQQLRDRLLDRQLMREISLSSAFNAQQGAYQRAQAGLAEGISSATATGASNTTGLGAALTDFFNAFQSLAASPTDVGVRQALMQKAAILTDGFNRVDARLDQVQSDLDTQIASDVAVANDLLATIASLNEQIGRVEIGNPGSAVDLRDLRQAKLEELAAKLPIEARDSTDGQVQVVVHDQAGADVVLVDLTSVVAPLSFDGTSITAGSGGTVLGLSSGSISGALSARDGAVQELRASLDQMAAQLVAAVNSAYNPTGAAGGDFFVATGLLAGSIQVAGTVNAVTLRAGTGAAGDNSIAAAVAALADTSFSTAAGDAIDGTLHDFYGSAVSSLGQALSTANANVESQTNVEKLVRSQRDAVSGVSLDEEMADLMRYQRAYQAASRVFSIIDSLLESVVNGLGRN